MTIVHISWGGPTQRFPTHNGRTREWELHRYHGPYPLKRDGNPMSINAALREPKSSWDAATEAWKALYDKKAK